MTFNIGTVIAQQTARYLERLDKHRCVRCGDQHEDDYVKELCERCDPREAGDDYSADHRADDPRRGQAAGLNALRRL